MALDTADHSRVCGALEVAVIGWVGSVMNHDYFLGDFLSNLS